MTVSDLVDLLESSGFTVAPPGDNTTALPCVVLSPVALDPQAGNRLLWHVIDICPAVQATPWKEQYTVLEDYTVSVVKALSAPGTQFQFLDRFPFETDTDRAVPAMFHRINVRFAGPDLCPT